MTINIYYKCKICDCVCNLKYQCGYSKKHPIRYKCTCGVSIRGDYEENRGFFFENAIQVENVTPRFVVYCSGEFFTIPPFGVQTFEETVGSFPTPFILATQLLEYEDFRKEFTHIIDYRDNRHIYVRAINELYANNNLEKVKKVIREQFDPNERMFPLNNEADYIRATTMINQFQFLNHDGVNRTPRTTSILTSLFIKHKDECRNFLMFIKSINKLEIWKKQVHNICDQIYEKIDLLMPAVSVDFVKNQEDIDLDLFAITTTSFEEIKQLYVDLYEMIGSLLFLALGIDNIILREDFNAIKDVTELNVKDLIDVMKMRNKGNIIKLIDDTAPIESLICKSLNANIRNSIGHYNYISYEIADSFGQKIEFVDSNNKEKNETKSLLQVCHDTWQMYKTLGIFNEIIHHLEIQIISLEGKFPSFVNNPVIFSKLFSGLNRRKVYPNDPCPCGSGLKYKKCCSKKED